jgi:hypothetical protein
MAAKLQVKSRKPRKRSSKPLSNAQLLKLAAKQRPPQSWYEESVDPTKPQSAKR